MGGGGCSDLPYNSIFSYLRDEPVVPRNLTARPAALGREPLKSSNCSPRHCLGHCSFCLLPFAFCLLPFSFLLYICAKAFSMRSKPFSRFSILVAKEIRTCPS